MIIRMDLWSRSKFVSVVISFFWGWLRLFPQYSFKLFLKRNSTKVSIWVFWSLILRESYLSCLPKWMEFQILQQRVSDLIHLNFKSTPSPTSLVYVHLGNFSNIVFWAILQDLIFSCPVQLIAMPNPLERVSYQIFLNSKIALTSLALCLVLIW